MNLITMLHHVPVFVHGMCLPVYCLLRRHSRSMRSSSPDHHHHHSAGRHREPPPPRGSSHWNHGGWSGSSDHHYPYDYDYGSTTSSHHYSRRGRHSARLGKPEMLMEDARKLKHTGDRTVSLLQSSTTPELSLRILTIAEFRSRKSTVLLRCCPHLYDILR